MGRAIRSNSSKDQVTAKMRKKGLRITLPRNAILDYILSMDEHPSARRILDKVEEK
jgi:Fe2+ or Zn2+ uptake regulation protein